MQQANVFDLSSKLRGSPPPPNLAKRVPPVPNAQLGIANLELN